RQYQWPDEPFAPLPPDQRRSQPSCRSPRCGQRQEAARHGCVAGERPAVPVAPAERSGKRLCCCRYRGRRRPPRASAKPPASSEGGLSAARSCLAPFTRLTLLRFLGILESLLANRGSAIGLTHCDAVGQPEIDRNDIPQKKSIAAFEIDKCPERLFWLA